MTTEPIFCPCGELLKNADTDPLKLTMNVGKYTAQLEAQTYRCKKCGRNTTITIRSEVSYHDIWKREISK